MRMPAPAGRLRLQLQLRLPVGHTCSCLWCSNAAWGGEAARAALRGAGEDQHPPSSTPRPHPLITPPSAAMPRRNAARAEHEAVLNPVLPESDGGGRPADTDRTCWICYCGDAKDPVIAPCDCKGSMRWVHAKCLHKWVTTRVVSATTDGPSNAERFVCPHCKVAYLLGRASDRDGAASGEDGEGSGGSGSEIWPDWWPWPKHFGTLDPELVSSFRWRLIQPLLCIAVHLLLLLVTGWYIKEFWRDVGENGVGEMLSLKDVTARQLKDQPFLSYALSSAFGDDLVKNPVRVDIQLGWISKKWSMTFAAIQHFHGTSMMFSFILFLWGGYEVRRGRHSSPGHGSIRASQPASQQASPECHVRPRTNWLPVLHCPCPRRRRPVSAVDQRG
eukprot:SAG22_NODE_19_length_32182_cov_39.206963_17_plen_388_part_00